MNVCVPNARATVGFSLTSCTDGVTSYASKKFLLVDTPGFNDTNPDKTDRMIVQQIIDWIRAK